VTFFAWVSVTIHGWNAERNGPAETRSQKDEEEYAGNPLLLRNRSINMSLTIVSTSRAGHMNWLYLALKYSWRYSGNYFCVGLYLRSLWWALNVEIDLRWLLHGLSISNWLHLNSHIHWLHIYIYIWHMPSCTDLESISHSVNLPSSINSSDTIILSFIFNSMLSFILLLKFNMVSLLYFTM
jgi:hypothetical protein